VINEPERVLASGRAAAAERFGAIPGVRVPRMERIARAALTSAGLLARGWTFPLLVRSPGFQAGRHFELVEEPAALDGVPARLPGAELFAIAFADTRGADGWFRKYRVLFVEGRLYPVHLAISTRWKVHYFSADMTERADFRDEERRFLADMNATLGPSAVRALEAIAAALGLDYAGIDFGIDAAGNVVVFEANATMAVFRPPEEERWRTAGPATTRSSRPCAA